MKDMKVQKVCFKIVAANPNNMEAAYWLGQTYLDQNRIAY